MQPMTMPTIRKTRMACNLAVGLETIVAQGPAHTSCL
jgi:hypothetical protein